MKFESLAAPSLTLLLLFAFFGALPAAAVAQEEAAAVAEETGEATAGAFDEVDEGSSSAVAETIRSLIEREEEALAGEGYGYDRGIRRDPFVPLGGAGPLTPTPCANADELRCVPIDDVEITGVYMTASEAVAQARGSEANRAFLLVVGDQLLDGEVVSVEIDRVVFRQRIERADLNLKPFREVVKELNP